MAKTGFRGPAYSMGSMEDGRVEAQDGPGIEYQANAFPDPRFFPTRKDSDKPGQVPCFLNSPFTVMTDTIPSTTSTTALAAAQATTNGTPLTLATVAPGGSAQNVPSFAPVKLATFQTQTINNVLALDFGYTTGNITAGSGSVTNILDPTVFQLGQWICIGGAGNSAKTLSLFTQVVGIGATSITVSPVSAATLTAAPIGSTNLPVGAYVVPGVVPTSVDPYLTAGFARIFNPQEGLARNLTITANAGATGGNVTMRGFDVYGVPMSEVIVAAAASTVAGKKAFKYLLSATPAFTDAGHTYSVGFGDVVGINLRNISWEFMNIFWNGGFAVSNTGWLAADVTSPATGTTGDVRGTVNLGTLATIGAASNGVRRLTLAMTIRLIDNISATPLNVVPLFGVPQFTN